MKTGAIKVLYINYNSSSLEYRCNLPVDEKFEVVYAGKEEDVYRNFKLFIPDIIIFDSDIFDRALFQFLAVIKSFDPIVPLVFCSPLKEEAIFIKALTEGADICVKKEYSDTLFLLQIKSIVNLLWQHKYGSVGDVPMGKNSHYNVLKHELCVNCVSNKLTSLESRLFYVLCYNLNKTTYRNVLLLAGWESEHVQYELQLNKYIMKFRKLLSVDPSVKIATVKGFGYRLEVS